MGQRDADELQRIVARSPVALGRWVVMALIRALLDFLNRLGRHWFMLLVLFGGVCLAIRGSILFDFGVAFLFRDDGDLRGYGPEALLRSPGFFTELFGVLLAGAVWVFAVDLDAAKPTIHASPGSAKPKSALADAKRAFHWELPGFAIRIVLLGLLPALALLYPASSALPALSYQNDQFTRAGIGWLVGLVLTLTVLSIGHIVEGWFIGLDGHAKRFGPLKPKTRSRVLDRVLSWVDWDHLIWRVIILWAMYVVTWVAMTKLAIQLPVVAMFALLGLALASYVALNFLIERMRFYAVIAILGLIAFVHRGDPYFHSFPSLKQQYLACDRKYPNGVLPPTVSALAPDWCQPATGGNPLALLPSASLKSHKTPVLSRGQNGERPLPKLVVVAISGGAYRAAFWGALVLDKLRELSVPGQRLEGLAQNIRLLTGASGGMVPAAYFVMLNPKDMTRAEDNAKLVNRIISDVRSADFANCAEPGLPGARAGDGAVGSETVDSLSPIARQLVEQDLFNIFVAKRPTCDRGQALELQWRTLNVTFADLRSDTKLGRRPSIIFAPMIAETGQPLLISDLDLVQMSDPKSHQTVELFRALPDAATKLTLRTAVRMSATFPFITPPGALPTQPPLHVLDAGYLDNYGMGIALGYLKQPDVLDWVSTQTSGVIIIQINAFPDSPPDTDKSSETCRDNNGSASSDWVSRALLPLTSSLTGLFSSRGASTRFRNDQEFDTLKQLLAAGPRGKSISLERVIFANSARASFSWFLPKQDFECMKQELAGADFGEKLRDLEAQWKAEPLTRPAAISAVEPPPGVPDSAVATPAPIGTASLGPAMLVQPAAASQNEEQVPPDPTLGAGASPKP